MQLFDDPGQRVLSLLSAGNLATTQAVVSLLTQLKGTGVPGDLFLAATGFDAAQVVGDTLREVIARDGDYVRPYGDPDASFLLGGQILGEAPRLFQVYSAGNFIEATRDTPFLQIGETKYGKPILDRMIRGETSLGRASKCALLSMDATIRSNLSVAPPIDVLCYRPDSLIAGVHRRFEERDPYLEALRTTYAERLEELFGSLPNCPDFEEVSATASSELLGGGATVPSVG
jgi:putative proteasome-type protease